MLRNIFKISVRNIIRHKAHSIINISGLAVGMASSILIFLWVQNEWSYDRFNKNAGQIYRINTAVGDFKTALAPAGMTQGFQSAIPAIKNTVRVVGPRNSLFSVGDRKFEENRIFYADSTFLDVFSFPLVKGDVRAALQRPDGILITEDMAKKYFGKENPIGKVLRKENTSDVVVTGVLATIPSNSHLQFDFIIPLSAAEQRHDMTANLWTNFIFYDYVQLDDHFNATPSAIARLEHQMNEIFKQYNKEIAIDIDLQPLTRIHLHSNLQMDLAGHGNIQYVHIFFIVAILILIVACINFMNLATARSARRAKEVGLRKVLGAVRGQLIGQFLGESLLISFFSLLVATLLVWLGIPSFNSLAGKTLNVNVWDGKLLLSLLGISIATGLVSGSYPAAVPIWFSTCESIKRPFKKPWRQSPVPQWTGRDPVCRFHRAVDRYGSDLQPVTIYQEQEPWI